MWHEHLFILQRLPFFYRQFDCLTVRKKSMPFSVQTLHPKIMVIGFVVTVSGWTK